MNVFQELAKKYDAWFHTPHGRYVWQYERDIIFSLAELRPGNYVADIGCGTGMYTTELLAGGAKVVGIDISPEMLAIARERTAPYKDRVTFVEADAAALPFTDNQFDQVVSITAMEFFDNPAHSLDEMLRIVKPGGQVIVATLNSRSLWAAERRIKTWLKPTIFSHAHFYSLRDVAALFYPHAISQWRGGIFIPPFAPGWLIKHPGAVEHWGQKHLGRFGAFIAVRVVKEAALPDEGVCR